MHEYENCKSVCDPDIQLETVECSKCHFHLGVDATYLDKIGDVKIVCPICKSVLMIPGFD